jgi:hypothetical protein
MKRIIVLSSLATSAVWVTMTAISMVFLLPAVVDAQASRILAEDIVVGAVGQPSVHVGGKPNTPPGSTRVEVLSADGTALEGLAMGGVGPTVDPAAYALNINNANGNGIRVGTGTGANLHLPVITMSDGQGKLRYIASLDADGNPSIQLFDADGNVVWSAP